MNPRRNSPKVLAKVLQGNLGNIGHILSGCALTKFRDLKLIVLEIYI